KGEQWQRALVLLSEMREARLESDVISYSAGISACEKGEQWQHALALLSEMRDAKLEPNAVSYNAGISACEKCVQWQQALVLLSEICETKLEANVIAPTMQEPARAGELCASIAFSATRPGSARVEKASSGSGRWRCSARCGRRSWSSTKLQRRD
ncbi:unnamed protein product, partial [Prorocentrum cordatum]